MMEPILLIRTGGTIDAEAYENPSEPPRRVQPISAKQSPIAALVHSMRAPITLHRWAAEEETRFVKDSNAFSDNDIRDLAVRITQLPYRLILLTHGTDHMTRNATILSDALAGHTAVIVFVGAVVPLSMDALHPSDGVAAMRFASNHIARQAPGVYVVARMAGDNQLSFFTPNAVEKDREASIRQLAFIVRSTNR